MLTSVRYLDIWLVLLSAPLVLAAGLPVLGYLVGVGAWLLTRLATEFVHGRALRLPDPRAKAALHVGAMLGRVWIVALGVIAARYAGGTADGVTAAVVVLAAFTVYLFVTIALRGGPVPPRTT
jgi:cation transporter-like permease